MAYNIKRPKTLDSLNKNLSNLGIPTSSISGEIVKVPLSRIQEHPENVKIYSLENIDELAEHIKEQGLLQPVILREMEKDSYQLLVGNRRLLAVKRLKHETIDAVIIKNVDDLDAEMILISSNAYREKTALELAEEARRLKELYIKKQKAVPEFLEGKKSNINKAVAATLNKSTSQINRSQRLLNLIPSLQEAVSTGVISSDAAEKFADFDIEAQQLVHELLQKRQQENQTITRNEAASIRDQYKTEQLDLIKRLNEKDRQIQALKDQISNVRNKDEVEVLKRKIKELEKEKQQSSKVPWIPGPESEYIFNSLRETAARLGQDILSAKENHLFQDKKSTETIRKLLQEALNNLDA